jgi:hypothetical protein
MTVWVTHILKMLQYFNVWKQKFMCKMKLREEYILNMLAIVQNMLLYAQLNKIQIR